MKKIKSKKEADHLLNVCHRLIREKEPQQALKILDKIEPFYQKQKYAEEKYKNKWLVNVADGSVAMGSATRKWAISIPYMQKTGMTFKDVIELTNTNKEDELAKRAQFGTPWGLVYRIQGRRVDATLYSIGELDVSRIAERLGGGGHRNASGFSVDLDLWLAEFVID